MAANKIPYATADQYETDETPLIEEIHKIARNEVGYPFAVVETLEAKYPMLKRSNKNQAQWLDETNRLIDMLNNKPPSNVAQLKNLFGI